jgi:solute carrier family 66 (lysosomal lysine-arginine transporter), member 1
MSLPLRLSATAATLPAHCSPTTAFLSEVSTYFHTCIPTPLAFISSALGTLSIVSWLFAQLPQIYKNYQLQSTAGLSMYFLIEWCLGDTANLLGCLFTDQAGWQIVIASYYVFVDVCLVSQFFWYTYFKPRIQGQRIYSASISDRSDSDSDIINGLSPINSHFGREEMVSPKKIDPDNAPPAVERDAPRFSDVNYEKASPSRSSPIRLRVTENPSSKWAPGPSPRTVLYIATLCALLSKSSAAPLSLNLANDGTTRLFRLDTPTEIAGTILSWTSTLLYLGSRLPQLYKNWDRQSTAGLSPLLFMAAFCGNFFYSLSLLTNPNAWNDFPPYGGHGWAGYEGSERWSWVARAAPFFLGAAGVLGLDGAMGIQFLLYRENKEEKIVKIRDSKGRSQWQKVSGWMRGWVPSMSGKERVVAREEGERLLSESRELARSRYGSL